MKFFIYSAVLFSFFTSSISLAKTLEERVSKLESVIKEKLFQAKEGQFLVPKGTTIYTTSTLCDEITEDTSWSNADGISTTWKFLVLRQIKCDHGNFSIIQIAPRGSIFTVKSNTLRNLAGN